MEIKVNGKDETIDGGLTIQEFLSRKNVKKEEVVVELNGVIVTKDQYPSTVLNDRDYLEVLRFVGGG